MMEDNLSEINREIDWNSKVSDLWFKLEAGKEISIPDDIQEAAHYIKRLRYLMEHNYEKYRDSEGRDLYKKIENYMSLLESKVSSKNEVK